ncbi:ABC transporter ATP-binding protein [Marinospirillum alkaliphilum]|uniref:NitT/TauT family transport system ATP-binding protein n=1 Tax=Marinospirillum alkaliphilum DSM 21637 TaxID=1122209 RepID=A0A1K1WMX4_9GAMM|nr:ABC transporter ATP-binding protein [Marinospirillum alkaliphilum]SFX38316.1 NitT/TauT family transport system ATP-binding protein [Marinospirillum alkaliphilum DSM 21637]
MLEARNLWKRYGDKVVLERISVSVQEGEFVTLVGTSGCGKSTFLKLLLGTETASEGQLLLDGQPVRDEPDSDRGIVFQQYSVFPHMTVLDNVMAARAFARRGLTGYLFGQARREAQGAAMELLHKVGLGHALKLYPHQLSGGMRQRLAIAQALLAKPRILLLDEPFGALDPGIRADMHQLVLELWQSHQLTVFMVTHDLKEGFYLGTRLWVFDKLRHDPQAPDAYGAGITYDLPVGKSDRQTLQAIQADLKEPQHDIQN